MALNRRRCTRECKRPVVREREAGTPPAQAAREDQMHPTMILRWRQAHRRDAEHACASTGHLDNVEARIAEVERRIGQLTVEKARLPTAWRRLEGPGQRAPSRGER